jgi:prepilin-type N-terminal cleavage/methylation domain-containing protein
MKSVNVSVRIEMHKWRASPKGMTLPEVMIAVALAAIVLAAGVVSANRYMSQRTLLGWSDVIVNDIRAAQQVSLARRSAVVVTFTAKAGVNPAVYTTAVGGGSIRQQTLPGELNLSAQTIQFTTLGVPTSGSAVNVVLSDSVIGKSRTITVAPATGTVTVQ